jgi:hypothetical protein
MAAMGSPEPAMRQHLVEIRGPNQRMAWALWILVSVIGAVVAALIAWQVRSLFLGGPAFSSEGARYAGTVVEALVAGGAQWLVWRHYRFAVDWWVPVTVAANLLNGIIVIPSVLHLAVGAGTISPTASMVAGATTLAAAGLVVGTAQALVLRDPAGNKAWAWVPATIIGGALAGAITITVSVHLFGLPYVVFLSVITALGAVLTAASQAPVVRLVLR